MLPVSYFSSEDIRKPNIYDVLVKLVYTVVWDILGQTTSTLKVLGWLVRLREFYISVTRYMQ